MDKKKLAEDAINASSCLVKHQEQPPEGAGVHIRFRDPGWGVEGFLHYNDPTSEAPHGIWVVEAYYRPGVRRQDRACVLSPDHEPHPHCPRQYSSYKAAGDALMVAALDAAYWDVRNQIDS